MTVQKIKAVNNIAKQLFQVGSSKVLESVVNESKRLIQILTTQYCISTRKKITESETKDLL